MSCIQEVTTKKFNINKIADKVLDVEYVHETVLGYNQKVVVIDVLSEDTIQVLGLESGDVFNLVASQVSITIDKDTTKKLSTIFGNIAHFGYKEM